MDTHPTFDAAIGAWAINAPAWQYESDDLRTHVFPEPSVRVSIALGSRRRTAWQFGGQFDLFHRSWDWRGETWEEITSFRADLQVGARTAIGDPARGVHDGWIEWGGGFAALPSRSGSRALVTYVSPTLRVAGGYAWGTRAVRPFVLVEGRTGLLTWGTPSCLGDTPCASTWNFIAGPGIALMVGLQG